MNPDNIWKKELMEFTRSKKTLILKLILPLILAIPLVIPQIPLTIKSNIFILILIFISIFGSAVSLIQLKESKMIERLSVLPISSYEFTLDYLIANTVMDFFKLAIPFILVLIIDISSFQILTLIWTLLIFFLTIIFANTLGFLVAMVAKTSGEGHLYSIIMVLGISSISGIFFTPTPGLFNFVSKFIPFNYLLTSITSYWNGTIIFSIFPIIVFIGLLLIIFLISPRFFKIE